MRFEGLDPWRSDGDEVIECEVEGATYDLHNLASFAGLEWTPPDTLVVIADYHPEQWTPPPYAGPGGRLAIRLTFSGVRHLQLRQAGDFAVEAADGITGWHLWPEGEGGRIELHAGDATACFTAAAVTFDARPWDAG